MYAYIKGKLVQATPAQAIVEVHGIGYIVLIPCSALGQLPALGEDVHFYTSFIVRELSQALYGFLTSQERTIFEVLLNVVGIGPKMALSLIGHLPLDRLQLAIQEHDLTILCKVPGVGKKTAERLIVELKDKLPAFSSLAASEIAISLAKDPKAQQMQDAMLALINLGYNQHTAQKAIKQTLKEIPDGWDLALLITQALRNV